MNNWDSNIFSKIIWGLLALFMISVAMRAGSALRHKISPIEEKNSQRGGRAKNQKTKKESSKESNNRKKYRSYMRLAFYVLLSVLLSFISHRGYLSGIDYAIFGFSFAVLLVLPIIELFRSVDYSILDSLLLITIAIRLDTEYLQNGEKIPTSISLENPLVGFLQSVLVIGLITELLQFSILSQNMKKAEMDLLWKYYTDPAIDRKKRITWDLFNFISPLLPVLLFPIVPNKENAPKWVLITWWVTIFISFFFPLLLVANRDKLRQPKIRIFFRSLETLTSVVLLSCGILYILYGFNVIELIAESITYYSPNISKTVGAWLSNLLGYAISGIVGNVAYDLIKKFIKDIMDTKKINGKQPERLKKQ